MATILCVLLFIVAGITTFQWWVLNKEVKQITKSIQKLQQQKGNSQIRVGSQNPSIVELANAVNQNYETTWNDRREHARSLLEMQKNMQNISHDLRTPLTSVLGYLNLLGQAGNTQHQEEHYRSVAYTRAEQLNEMVNALFELTRLEAGAYPFQMAYQDANAILAQTLAGMYESFMQMKKSPEVQLSDSPLWVIADQQALGRIFENLLQNMCQYAKGELNIQSIQNGSQVQFFFSNTTVGMKREDVAHLFQRFYTADLSRTKKSTGLGLSITKEFVEKMGGTITASLQEDKLQFLLEWKFQQNGKYDRSMPDAQSL